MLSLEPKLEALRAQLGDRVTNALIARERREVFSVYPEIRIAAWAGATLLAAAAAILLRDNLDRIGPLALSVMVAVAAAACYAWTWWRRAAASVVDDYVLLLGALLVSADVAFIEAQFHLLDDAWKHHLLLLAVLHAAGAYAYRSRMLLSLSIMALAGWLGVDENRVADDLWRRAFLCAAILIVWRALDRKLVPSRRFARTFEHFAANVALIGGLSALAIDVRNGALATVVIAAGVIAWGFRTRSEPFVLYGFVYGVIAIVALLLDLVDYEGESAIVVTAAIAVAIAGLLALHAHFRRRGGEAR